MSVQAVSWVLDYSESDHGSRLVAIVLAEHADRYGCNAWPSIATIERRSNLKRSAVYENLRWLREAGEIAEQGRRPNGTVIYRLPYVVASNPHPRPEHGARPNSGPKPSLVEEGTLLGDIPNEEGSTTSRPAKARIDGLVVSADEWVLGLRLLEVFNEENKSKLGPKTTRGRPSPAITMVVCRIREYPDATRKEMEEAVRGAFKDPYWNGRATPGNVFGPGAFPKALAGQGRPGRKPRFKDERAPDPARKPNW